MNFKIPDNQKACMREYIVVSFEENGGFPSKSFFSIKLEKQRKILVEQSPI